MQSDYVIRSRNYEFVISCNISGNRYGFLITRYGEVPAISGDGLFEIIPTTCPLVNPVTTRGNNNIGAAFEFCVSANLGIGRRSCVGNREGVGGFVGQPFVRFGSGGGDGHFASHAAQGDDTRRLIHRGNAGVCGNGVGDIREALTRQGRRASEFVRSSLAVDVYRFGGFAEGKLAVLRFAVVQDVQSGDTAT